MASGKSSAGVKSKPRYPQPKRSNLVDQLERSWRFTVDKAKTRNSLDPLKGILNPEIPLKLTSLPVTDDEFVALYWGSIWLALHDGFGLAEIDVFDRAEAYRLLLWESGYTADLIQEMEE